MACGTSAAVGGWRPGWLSAFDSTSRRQGLLGRSGLANGTALVLAPCWAIHTAFMRFPIDVAFVGRDGRIRRLSSSVRPWRIRASLGTFAVVELPAGALTQLGQPSGRRAQTANNSLMLSQTSGRPVAFIARSIFGAKLDNSSEIVDVFWHTRTIWATLSFLAPRLRSMEFPRPEDGWRRFALHDVGRTPAERDVVKERENADFCHTVAPG